MKSQLEAQTGRDRLGKAVATGLIIAMVVTALAHGAVEPWSLMLFELIILLLVTLWACKVVADKRLSITIPPVALPIAALAAIGLVQSVAFTNSAGKRLSLSLDVESTRLTVTALLFLLISLVIAANFFSSRRRLAVLAGFFVIYGLALALFALVQHFTWNGKFYWIRPNNVGASPFGPFVSHSHFAGYINMLAPIPIALILTRAVRGEFRLLCGFAAIVMSVTCVASLSRGGMLSLAATMIFLIVMSFRLPKPSAQTGGLSFSRAASRSALPRVIEKLTRISPRASAVMVVIAIAAVIVMSLVWLGPDSIVNRVTKGEAAQSNSLFSNREWMWRDTLTMIKANPILGVGLGAYGTAFPIYTQSDGALRVPQAHNDYLQVVADCGIVGGLIAVWFLVIIFRAANRAMKSRDPLLAGLALGASGAIFSMLVHSLFDFNLQLPSNALLFLVITAVVSRVAQTVEEPQSALVAARRGEPEAEMAMTARRAASEVSR